jgi:NO-binding membrane sensor protein with MHYT domain
VQANYFAYGAITPVLSYALSVLGSLLGLVCTARARRIADPRRRARWLILAAWAIGGTGIWVMHFVAMIGYTVSDEQVRYDPALTLASLLIAIVVVAIGLFIVGFGRPTVVKILAAGLLTGLGVAGMHYTGMAAMNVHSNVGYDRTLVEVSVVIAVVAATVALWFTVALRRGALLFVAALIMGVAVNGMHYTAMYALRLTGFVAKPVQGLPPITFLGPIVIFVVSVIAVLLFALLSRSGESGDQDNTLRIGPLGPLPGDSPATNRAGASAAAFVNRPR